MSKIVELLRILYPYTVEIDRMKKKEVTAWLRKNHIADFEVFYFERGDQLVMVVGFETEESHFFATMRYFNS